MTPRAFVISTVTATSLGFTAGFVSSGLTAKASVSSDKKVTINKILGSAAKASLESVLDSKVCPDVETKVGLDPGVCVTADHAKAVCFSWVRERLDEQGDPLPDQAQMSGTYGLGGSWQFGPPQ